MQTRPVSHPFRWMSTVAIVAAAIVALASTAQVDSTDSLFVLSVPVLFIGMAGGVWSVWRPMLEA